MLMTNGHLRKSILLSCMVIQCLSYVCLHCSSSTSSRDCGKVRTCGPHQVCYTDSFSTAYGVRLEFGCRDKMQCWTSLIGKRSHADGDLLTCSQCCNDDLCNARLCGGTYFQANSGPICYDCGEKPVYNGCNDITHCGWGQVCEVVQTISSTMSETYTTGCEEKLACEFNRNQSISAGQGKPCGSICCSSNVCNKASCDNSHLQPNTVPAGTASVTTVQQQHIDTCHPNPCVHGMCYSSYGDYLCICDSNYSGTNCDIGTTVTTSTSTIATTTIHTHCNPNPCVHGKCYNGEKDFMCVCDPTYSGKTCDIGTTTIPPTTTVSLLGNCNPNPCIHGGCFSSVLDYFCVCDPSYTGKNCDTGTVKTTSTTTSRQQTTMLVPTAPVSATSALPLDSCHPNPCVHGMCYSSSRDYLCKCDSTYSGKNCDIGTTVTTSTSTIATTTIIHTHCNPNPCVHGRCLNGEKDFLCVCDPTYSGKTCDIGTTTLPPTTTIRLLDKCHPNPCIHGICYSSVLDYVCVCDPSFTGKNCDSGTAKLTAAITTQQTTLHVPTTPVSASVAPTLAADECTFQYNMCQWNNSVFDTMQWQRHKGTTPTPHTGPLADHTNNPNNYYLFLESSGHPNKVANLDSRPFPGGDYCVDFYYHMYGSGIANLVLNVLAGNTRYHLKTWSGDKGEHWYHHRINAHIRNSSTIKFEFEGHTGSSIYSDMAIDDITIYLGNCTL